MQLFGQSFLLDSFVLGHVVFDTIRFKGAPQSRMMPPGLDVAAALGSNEAVALLEGDLRTFSYGSNLLAARAVEVAVGDANFLIVAVNNDKEKMVFVGPAYSYYEFTVPSSARLKDEEWQRQLMQGSAPAPLAWTSWFKTPGQERRLEPAYAPPGVLPGKAPPGRRPPVARPPRGPIPK